MADSDGDLVRSITIRATGDKIDETTQSTLALGDAVGDLTDKNALLSDANSAWNSVIGSLGGSFTSLAGILTGGVVAGLGALLDYTVKANKDLADMATLAHQTGLSLTELQGVQFGGALVGINTDTINAGLQQSATLLNDAQRNANSLSREFEANGLSIKNANGQLISQNQLLVIAGNLIANAKDPGDELAIAKMLGFTKEWIPLLEQGGSAMAGLGDKATAAGVVISDEVVQRAVDFDTNWRKSSVEFSSYMKAALTDLLPYMDDLIERGSKWAASLKKSDIQAGADETLKSAGDAVGAPDSLVVHVDPEGVQKLSGAFDTFMQAPVFSTQTWSDFGKAFSSSIHIMTPEEANDKIPGYAASQIREPQYPSQQQMDDAFSKSETGLANLSQKAKDWAQDAAQDAAGGFSEVALRAKDANDAVDRAINSLTKHTEVTKADALAVGQGAGALAGLKVNAAETAAVLANGNQETDKQKAAFDALKVSATDAANALALAKIDNTISRGTQTSMLSPEDVSIANQLKDAYPNVALALNSVEASGLRTNMALSEVANGISSGVTQGFASMLNGSKSVSQGFAQMGTSIINAIDQMIVKLMIVGPLMEALQSGMGGNSGILSMFGINPGNIVGSYGQASNATGLGAGTGGISFPMFASGTDNAPGGWSIVGENGPEIINLNPGSQVLPNGSMPSGGGSGGGNNVNVQVVNNTGVNAQPTTSTNSNGDVTVTLNKAVDTAVGNSLYSRARALTTRRPQRRSESNVRLAS